MIEIKLRMWDGKKIQGPFDISELAHEGNGWSMATLKKIKWMLYTNLKDKNGKEVYEGDILMRQEYTKYNRNAGRRYKIVLWGVGNTAGFNIRKADKYEIIGNIYENPELLNKT